MGGKGSGRLNKTDAFLKKNSDPYKSVGNVASVGNEVLVIPNHSGMLDAGTVHREPTDELDPVNKAYVDAQIRSAIDLFLTNNASDIATYLDMEIDIVTDPKETITKAISTGTQLIASFASILDEPEIDNITLLKKGVYGVHIHSSTNFQSGMTIFYEFYHRTAGGTETLMGTSHDSSILTSVETDYDLHATIASDQAFVAGDRIVIKVYGRNTNSPTKNISLFIEGDTAARVEFPGFISLRNNVKASAVIADNAIVRGDGGSRGLQDSGVVIDDNDKMIINDGMLFQEVGANNVISNCVFFNGSAWEYFRTGGGGLTFIAPDGTNGYYIIPSGTKGNTLTLPTPTLAMNSTSISYDEDVNVNGDFACLEFKPGTRGYSGGSTDALDVEGATVIKIASSSGNVVIGGLDNGTDGQMVWLLKGNASNTLTIEHNEATGTEKMFNALSVDLVLGAGFRGAALYSRSSSLWIQIGGTD